jgi:hypothetical protein
MLFSRITGRRFAIEKRSISKAARYSLFFCGFLGIASALLVSSATIAILNAAAANADPSTGGQVGMKTPPAMVGAPKAISDGNKLRFD